ncbi:MAG: chemotaxis protein CheW [Spirochaetia bacterium]
MSDKKTQEEEMLEEEDEDLQTDKYLLFKLGQEVYGINIMTVTDIIELQKITEVPDMPEYIRGVINLRGQVIPVMDLRLRFKMEPREYDDRTCIVIVNINEQPIGFIVDTVSEVVEIPEKNIDPAPEFKSGSAREKYIAGLGKVDNEVKILLDVSKIVKQEEIESMKETST